MHHVILLDMCIIFFFFLPNVNIILVSHLHISQWTTLCFCIDVCGTAGPLVSSLHIDG